MNIAFRPSTVYSNSGQKNASDNEATGTEYMEPKPSDTPVYAVLESPGPEPCYNVLEPDIVSIGTGPIPPTVCDTGREPVVDSNDKPSNVNEPLYRVLEPPAQWKEQRTCKEILQNAIQQDNGESPEYLHVLESRQLDHYLTEDNYGQLGPRDSFYEPLKKL